MKYSFTGLMLSIDAVDTTFPSTIPDPLSSKLLGDSYKF